MGISDKTLIKVAKEMTQDSYDAYLGGGLYKKRIPLNHRGKRGGARIILAFKKNKLTLFIYLFSKNSAENISQYEQVSLKKLANTYFSFDKTSLEHAIKTGELIEVANEKIDS